MALKADTIPAGLVADYVALSEAAQRLGISGARARALVGAGRLKAEKVGGQWIVHVKELERFAAIERRPGRTRDTIRVDPDVLEALRGRQREGEALVDVLRRLLRLPRR